MVAIVPPNGTPMCGDVGPFGARCQLPPHHEGDHGGHPPYDTWRQAPAREIEIPPDVLAEINKPDSPIDIAPTAKVKYSVVKGEPVIRAVRTATDGRRVIDFIDLAVSPGFSGPDLATHLAMLLNYEEARAKP